MNYEWLYAPELQELASKIIKIRDEVSHVEIEDILFLRESSSTPRALAQTFSLDGHPIGYFTNKPFAIVFYDMKCDELTENQIAAVMWHELMHIPTSGTKLVKHEVQDFYAVLGLGVGWQEPGKKIINILDNNSIVAQNV